jgi:hypothetical protein
MRERMPQKMQERQRKTEADAVKRETTKDGRAR